MLPLFIPDNQILLHLNMGSLRGRVTSQHPEGRDNPNANRYMDRYTHTHTDTLIHNGVLLSLKKEGKWYGGCGGLYMFGPGRWHY